MRARGAPSRMRWSGPNHGVLANQTGKIRWSVWLSQNLVAGAAAGRVSEELNFDLT